MGWDDNNYDYMSEDSGGGYTSEGGMDFGENQDSGINWNSAPQDTSWDNFGSNNTNQSFGNDDPWDPMAFQGKGFQTPAPQEYMTQQLPQQQGGSQDFLSRLFQNPGGLLKLGGALMSGDQNKKKASAYGQIARDPRLDPFGSQRGQYQQMASDFATTPTNNPVYQNIQAETLRKLQMQAASTGRRTNPTDVMARLQSAMMPQYNDTLRNYANLGGSQFGPQGSTIADMLAKSANAKTEGYASPVMNALGNLFKNDELDQGKQQAAAALSKYLNGA